MEKIMQALPLEGIDVIILAGGLGTRLRTVLPDYQKVVAPVAGRPFLAYLLSQVEKAGARRIILAVGYRADQVMAEIDCYKPPGVTLIPSMELHPMGSGGAVRQALQHVRSDQVLVMNGDSFVDAPFAKMVTLLHNPLVQAVICLTHVKDIARYGAVIQNEAGNLLAFCEKQPQTEGTTMAGLINAGVYLFRRQTLEQIPDGMPSSIERDVFPNLCGEGLKGVHGDGRFIDIGTPDSWYQAQKLFAIDV